MMPAERSTSPNSADMVEKSPSSAPPSPISWLGHWVHSGTSTVAAYQRYFGVINGKATLPLWDATFRFGASLGDELFFLVVLPATCWFWDLTVCSRVVTAWAAGYYIGHVWKDTTQLPRPPEGPPHFVVRLERHYENEYGMPSTHALNAILMPWYLVWLSWGRFGGSFLGSDADPSTLILVHGSLLAVASFWTLACIGSRLYLGVHSPADICMGILLGGALLFLSITLEAAVDATLSLPAAAAALVALVILLIATYPRPSRPVWLNSPGDTALILSAALGVRLGWFVDREVHTLNWSSGNLTPGVLGGGWGGLVALLPPGALGAVGSGLLALVIGTSTVFIVKVLVKGLCMAVAGALLKPAYGPADDPSINPIAQREREAASSPEALDPAAMGLSPRGDAAAAALFGYGDPSDKGGSGFTKIVSSSHPTQTAAAAAASGSSLKKSTSEAFLKTDDSAAAGKINSTSSQVVEIPLGKRYLVELPTKFFTYTAIGFSASFLIPHLLENLGLAKFGFPQ